MEISICSSMESGSRYINSSRPSSVTDFSLLFSSPESSHQTSNLLFASPSLLRCNAPPLPSTLLSLLPHPYNLARNNPPLSNMRPSTSTFLASAAILALGASAQTNGQIASLDSADSYCFFLPPMVGGDIAANEDAAIAFCNKDNPKAPGAKIFPDGFVLSAHWASTDSWVQITVSE